MGPCFPATHNQQAHYHYHYRRPPKFHDHNCKNKQARRKRKRSPPPCKQKQNRLGAEVRSLNDRKLFYKDRSTKIIVETRQSEVPGTNKSTRTLSFIVFRCLSLPPFAANTAAAAALKPPITTKPHQVIPSRTKPYQTLTNEPPEPSSTMPGTRHHCLHRRVLPHRLG